MFDLSTAAAISDWDMQTYMPPSGAAERSEILSTLAALTHDKFTSPEIGELLEALQPYGKRWIPTRTKPAWSRSPGACTIKKPASRASGWPSLPG